MRLDLLGHGLDDRAVAFLHRGECRPDVVLDLRAGCALARPRAAWGESAISRIASSDAPCASREVRPVSASLVHRVLDAERSASAWNRSSLDAIRVGRLVAREQGDDAILFGTRVVARSAPDLGGDLTHQGGRLLLERPQAFLELLVDRPAQRRRRWCSPLVASGSSSWCSSRRNRLRRGMLDCSSMTSLAIRGRCGASA